MGDLERRHLDATSALELLARDIPQLRIDRMSEIVGGWASFTFDIDGQWIARFPRNNEVAESTGREARLLIALADEVSFRVPKPNFVGDWDSWPYFVYQRIAGRPIEVGDWPAASRSLRTALGELRSFPVDRATRILDDIPSPDGWTNRYRELWPRIQEVVLPLLDSKAASQVAAEYASFINEGSNFPVCLVHNDLGPEHILVDDRTHEIAGIIDFEDAAIGDPVIDLVPIRRVFGADAFEVLIRGLDLGDRVEERMRFYSWMGAIHAILYGVSEDVDSEVKAGVAGLYRRLEAAF